MSDLLKFTDPVAAGLYAQVCADPSADAPRLVYADWLEEQGECDRAEFIRVQCELAIQRDPQRRPPASPDNDSRQDWLSRRERELFNGNKLAWFEFRVGGPAAYLNEIPPNVTGATAVRRGFVGAVRCRVEQWVGGACERCDGRPEQVRFRGPGATNPYHWACDACHGTGRAAALGPVLVRACPLEEVRLEGREPGASPPGRWAWCRHDGMTALFDLPGLVFDLIESELHHGVWKFFDSPDLAHAAASRASIAQALAQPEPAEEKHHALRV